MQYNNQYIYKDYNYSGTRIKKLYNDTSFKDIKVTHHAMMRAEERLGITGEIELKKICRSVKIKGTPIWHLNKNNYKEKFNLSYELYNYLVTYYYKPTLSTKCFYYKGAVYIFVGDKSRTLKTVVKVPETLKEDFSFALD